MEPDYSYKPFPFTTKNIRNANLQNPKSIKYYLPRPICLSICSKSKIINLLYIKQFII